MMGIRIVHLLNTAKMNLKKYKPANLKNIRLLLSVMLLINCILLVSCKKETMKEIYPASITFVNAVNDNTSGFYGFFKEGEPEEFAKLKRIVNNNYFHYATKYADPSIKFYINSDTLAKDKPALTPRLHVEAGGIYTHFIYGSKEQLKEKTIHESIPGYSRADSVTNVRMINLFEDRSIDIELLQPYAQILATDLKYEQLTGFIKLPCDKSVTAYQFQFRDHLTGNVLATFSNSISGPSADNRTQWIYRSTTLTLSGQWIDENTSNPQIFTVWHF